MTTTAVDEIPPAVLPYLATLRRLPDEVVLDMATREFEMADTDMCVCGWAFAAALSRAAGDKRPEDFDWLDRVGSRKNLAAMFGGTFEEWHGIFVGVCLPDNLPSIELAFLLRVAEAAE